MQLSPQWIREFVAIPADDKRLAEDLTAAGIAVESINGSGENAVFEMEIGTNRPDAMNHYGVAREASAIYDVALKPIDAKLPDARGNADFAIEIAEPDLCPRFTARVLRSIRIKPSPERVARRLGLLDQRPINNAVDATNYTLWEMGKPTHAFDLDLLEGGKIVVRRAQEGETLKTLDGIERNLTPEDLVVADARRPVALAGIMGGEETGCTNSTTDVLIESALWEPANIAQTGRKLGVTSDARYRFERGVDPAFMLPGLGKPVIITGSQIPLCEVRNDARENLITSLLLAAGYDIPEVCLYFGGRLLREDRCELAAHL